MFTGIVETMGSLLKIKPDKKGKTFIIEAKNLMDDLVENEGVQMKKHRTGYSLRMSGDIENPRIY